MRVSIVPLLKPVKGSVWWNAASKNVASSLPRWGRPEHSPKRANPTKGMHDVRWCHCETGSLPAGLSYTNHGDGTGRAVVDYDLPVDLPLAVLRDLLGRADVRTVVVGE